MPSPTVFLDERYMLHPVYETRNYDLATDSRTMDFPASGILIAGTAMSASAAELNLMDGVLATTAEINRATDTSTRIVAQTGATLTVTELLHDKKVITLDRAGGIVLTMPEPTGSGMVITFVVKTKFTSDATIVLPDTTNTALIGYADIVDSDTTDLIHRFTPGATFDLVTLDGTNTGGGLGCWIQYIDLATDVWSVRINEGVGGTAPATPFSST